MLVEWVDAHWTTVGQTNLNRIGYIPFLQPALTLAIHISFLPWLKHQNPWRQTFPPHSHEFTQSCVLPFSQFHHSPYCIILHHHLYPFAQINWGLCQAYMSFSLSPKCTHQPSPYISPLLTFFNDKVIMVVWMRNVPRWLIHLNTWIPGRDAV